eukprot:TRINITY_DN11288_c0_g1_i1.p1 TRINITY_DN11288_c0_g1~~TRINITY_DN11288_c0_g1_i1.p1  ORF type:complete len:443 (-),score=75.14 TRINITY_DN11288_c0_g1_i1:46-1269(-)
MRCPLLFEKNIKKITKRKLKLCYVLNKREYLTWEIFYSLMLYLYCDHVEEGLPDESYFQLYKVAHVYKLPHFKQCLYKVLMDAFDQVVGVAKLEFFRLGFAYGLNKVLKGLRVRCVNDLGDDFAIELLSLVEDDGVDEGFVEKLTELSESESEVKEPKLLDSTWEQDFKRIMHYQDRMDFVFKLESIDIRCHRAILAGLSPELRDLVEQSEIYETNMKPGAVRGMLSMFYYGNRDVSPTEATRILVFVTEFNVVDFMSLCKETIRKEISFDTVLSILQVTCDPKYEGKNDILKFQCLNFIIKNLGAMNFAPLQRMTPNVVAEILLAIQETVGVNWIIHAKEEYKKVVDPLQFPMPKKYSDEESTMSEEYQVADSSRRKTPRKKLGSRLKRKKKDRFVKTKDLDEIFD